MAESVEEDDNKKKAIALGVIVLFAVGVNAKNFMGKKEDPRKGRTSSRRGARRGATNARAGGRRAAAPARKSLLTPNNIPVLSDLTKKQIKINRDTKPDLIPEDTIRYDTRNPFVPLGVDDLKIQVAEDKRRNQIAQGIPVDGQDQEAAQSAPTGTINFRGVLPVSGTSYAILESYGSRFPFSVRPGEEIGNSGIKLLGIGPANTFVTLYNPEAKRDNEKITIVPRSGVDPFALRIAREQFLAQYNIKPSKRGRRDSAMENLTSVLLALAETEAHAKNPPPAASPPETAAAPKPSSESFFEDEPSPSSPSAASNEASDEGEFDSFFDE